MRRGPAEEPSLVGRHGEEDGRCQRLREKGSPLPEKVTSALLLGSFVALAFRSSEQEDEIEELEARKSSLRVANSPMSSIMWAWREELFKLAAMPSTPITAARLRHIYGEEDPPSSPASRTRLTTLASEQCAVPGGLSRLHESYPRS
ncbi:uncharacterized protein LOC123441848 [Hordeum vulgare subsp. vulgare]|uniref:uncharacterized protein LOC123441848 n=1 Tax=Hordeum vulgare subsp. vulgare TaxID=112509 RepID=UPI001D1A3548|nr:uncharacterized protein LOC123441848 [Hordeum vulgare subsp. vulgare]